jgi:hypothetical protein
MIDTVNIIMFLRGKRGRPAQTLKQVETNVASLRIYHIDEATRAVCV